MGRRQHARVLHVAAQIPELHQADTADVDDVIRLHDRRLRVWTIQHRADRVYEIEQILIQREQAEQSRGNLGLLVAVRRAGGVDLGLELGHPLAGEVLDLEQIDGDPTVISTTGPLGVLIRINKLDQLGYHHAAPRSREKKMTNHQSRLLVGFQIYVVIQRINGIFLAPILGIRELLDCAGHVELTRP